MKENYLIVGLGNIGKAYEKTRHNIGFIVVDALAEKYKVSFQKKARLKGEIAELVIEEKKVFLLKPTTYMNNSGESVRAVIDFFKIAICNILVIVDDIAIPFGEFRLRQGSGPGGHKGLESLERSLGSSDYPRLRIGIGDRKEGDLVSHVLGGFTKSELDQLPEVIKNAIEIIHLWLMQGMVFAMNQTNVRKKDKGVDNEN